MRIWMSSRHLWPRNMILCQFKTFFQVFWPKPMFVVLDSACDVILDWKINKKMTATLIENIICVLRTDVYSFIWGFETKKKESSKCKQTYSDGIAKWRRKKWWKIWRIYIYWVFIQVRIKSGVIKTVSAVFVEVWLFIISTRKSHNRQMPEVFIEVLSLHSQKNKQKSKEQICNVL